MTGAEPHLAALKTVHSCPADSAGGSFRRALDSFENSELGGGGTSGLGS